MSAAAMWRSNMLTLVLLIIVNFMLAGLGTALWIILGILLLMGGMAMCYRSGCSAGHSACAVRSTVESVRQSGERADTPLDEKYLRRAFDRNTGIRAVLASALIPYALGCAFIILTLLDAGRAAVAARVAAWIVSLPFWPTVMVWNESFIDVTPSIAAMVLISPFVLPLCTFAGYMQGPKLWARSEQAMKEGRRRAKARARVGRKMVSRQKGPEI